MIRIVRLAFLIALASALVLAAHAQTAAPLSFSITGGMLSPAGTFTGSFVIDGTTELVSSGQITATIGTNTYTLATAAASTIPGLLFLSDANGDIFTLALNGGISTLALNTLGAWNTSDASLSVAGVRYDVTAGTVAAAAASGPPVAAAPSCALSATFNPNPQLPATPAACPPVAGAVMLAADGASVAITAVASPVYLAYCNTANTACSPPFMFVFPPGVIGPTNPILGGPPGTGANALYGIPGPSAYTVVVTPAAGSAQPAVTIPAAGS